MHNEPSEHAGRTLALADGVELNPGVPAGGGAFKVEDWWDRVYGKSWQIAQGSPAALKYAMRAGFAGLPIDDEVVYGKLGSFGHLVHVSELVVPDGTEAADADA